ncbi:uncharacterized protein LOC127429909 [Myxocyprinus asiaticus]|uniref:uncharacterized protein LOC127429909 n=1 Tax=Myxocyprinus asiaticus TaxID=70543 RepID=UPI002222A98C|nr:uncharacterized protein LOC127429909 [Myxocyprinus asiaticus]
MVFTLLQRVILVIFLLPLCTESVKGETVDINTLGRIHTFFHENYEIGQYAVAINVPKEQCQANFSPSKKNFLKDDKGENVKNIIKNDINPVYKGTELIAAGVQRNPYTAHSEFLLLSSPLTYLLNKGKDRCVVFYTLNSPCINTCLSGKYNIKPGVDKLQSYQGMKAFVFTNIWTHDQDRKKVLKEKLKLIADSVPLFRCKNKRSCVLCGKPGSKEINEMCLNNENKV